MTEATRVGLTATLKTDFQTAETRITDALKAEGFGVLTEIDVKATLKKKIDVDYRPYKILGACNPRLAYRALTAAPEVGLLLPCNVTVEQVDAETIRVSAVEPLSMMGIVDSPDLEAIASEAHDRLARAIAAVEG